MKLSCLQENLNRGLNVVGRAVAARTTLPITNNILLNNHYGINISKGAKNNNISLNTISNSRLYGVSISSSNNNIVIRNNISLSGFYGIYLTLSNNNILVGNTISECDFYGVRIKASENKEVSRNIIFKNNRGIYLCCGSVIT